MVGFTEDWLNRASGRSIPRGSEAGPSSVEATSFSSRVSIALRQAHQTIDVHDIVRINSEKMPSNVRHHGPLRQMMAQIVFSPVVEAFTVMAILFNLCLVVYQTDMEAKCYPKYEANISECPTASVRWIGNANLGLLVFYSAEAGLKITLLEKHYFDKVENVFDVVICVMGWIAEVLSGLFQLSWLRILRLWRLVRVLNAMSRVREINMLVTGFSGAIRAMIFGVPVLLFTLLFCAIILVQFVHPVAVKISFQNCERCHRGFVSVAESILTLFQQIVAGDSWGEISIPVIEHSPLTSMLLPMVQLLIAMGIMNLILAVVVDRAMEEREHNKEKALLQERLAQDARKSRLIYAISDYDVDMNGRLTRGELDHACADCDEIRKILGFADVGHEELEEILDALAATSDGGLVSYGRFASVIHEIEAVDLRKQAVINSITASHRFAEQAHTLQSQTESLTFIEKKVSRIEKKIDEIAKSVRQSNQNVDEPGHERDNGVRESLSSVCAHKPKPSQGARVTRSGVPFLRSDACSLSNIKPVPYARPSLLVPPNFDVEKATEQYHESLDIVEELTRDVLKRLSKPTEVSEAEQDLRAISEKISQLRQHSTVSKGSQQQVSKPERSDSYGQDSDSDDNIVRAASDVLLEGPTEQVRMISSPKKEVHLL